MELKKMIIVLTVAISIVIGIMFGISYGWYAYSNAETRVGGSTDKKTPTVIFAQTDRVYSSTSMPIYDGDRYNYATNNTFTVTIGEELKDYQVGVEIFLKDIAMANELKIPNYKYELLEDGKVVGSGNFSGIGTNNSIRLTPMTIMKPTSYPTTYTYEFYLWLSEDGTDQNALMNKGFSAKINVNSAIKK